MNSLILLNSQHAYSPDSKQDLIPVHDGHPDILLEREAVCALSYIVEQLGGWEFAVPVSGWRSLEKQLEIYAKSLQENGPEFTAKLVAMPRHSEHQTGLAIDLGLRQPNIDFICPAFPYKENQHQEIHFRGEKVLGHDPA